MASDNKSPQVLAFGELLWDLLPGGKVLGGAPANFAYRLSELGTTVALVSRVGADELGREALAVLKEKGLSVDLVQTDPLISTGTVAVDLSPAGDAHYTIIPNVAYDFIEPNEQMLRVARECRAVCYGTLVQRSAQTRETLYSVLESAQQATKIVDINLRKDCYCPDTVRRSLEFADILKLNREELKTVGSYLSLDINTPSAFANSAMEEYGLELVLITCGSKGVLAFSAEDEELHVAGYQVQVSDTVGSGDNFSAAFLHKWLAGEDLEACCRFANRVGAVVASKKGGMPVVEMKEIESLPEAEKDDLMAI